MKLISAYKQIIKIMSKLDYYFCPPILHDAVSYCLPRCFQPDTSKELFQAIKRRIGYKPKTNAINKSFARHIREVYRLPENNDTQVTNKINRLQQLIDSNFVGKVRLYRELGRLEWRLDNKLLATLYRLRSMRMLGTDLHSDLITVIPSLITEGYSSEAEVASVMFGNSPDREKSCAEILSRSFEQGKRHLVFSDYANVIDRRNNESATVSVIVSLYKAASKLSTFLSALQLQTLNRNKNLELIIIDSNSPDNELAVLNSIDLKYPISYVYARTKNKESIQTAWNRGILLSRTAYLSFLGVDETLKPNALEILCAHLDSDPNLDWVQGNSRVTNVTSDGVFSSDVMTYDRRGYTQNHVYLETCYLSWVGALYRKSIHDRFGYYDGTYWAAGDTEFKNRVLPYIITKCIPELLGVFLNYPENRATASPRAEIEDLRAWHLHRTTAGVRYAMQKQDPEILEQLLVLALGYRKSYLQTTSTDFEYADTVAQVLRDRMPNSAFLRLADGVSLLLKTCRKIDQLSQIEKNAISKEVNSAYETASAVQHDHNVTSWLPNAKYQLVNDNRYQQHVHLW